MNQAPRASVLLTLAVLVMVGMSGCFNGNGHHPVSFLPPRDELSLGAGDGRAWDARLIAGLGDPGTSGLAAWPAPMDMIPFTFDLNGDGVDEVIGHSADTNVYVFDVASGRAVAVIPTKYPPAWHIERVLNGVSAGVLRPGESPSLVITNHAASVSVWRYDAQKSTAEQFVFEKMWEKRMTECYKSSSMDAEPVLADLTGDGALEIVVQTEEIGLYALRADGTTLWKHCWAGGNSAPVVDDLDSDGRPEAIFASDSGFISVLAGATGSPQWTFDATQHGVRPASIVVSPTTADLDGKAPKEIIFTARHATIDDPARYDENHMAIFAIHQDPTTWQGQLYWMRQPEWAHPMSNTRLVVQDVDHDGKVDVFGMDWNTIGHRPGDWEQLGPGHVFRLDARGNDVWVREMETWWSNKPIALIDHDRDGKYSVLVNGPSGEHDGIWRLSASKGEAEAFLALSGDWKLTRGPAVTDIYGDGKAQVIFTVEAEDPNKERGAILVVGT